LYNKKLALFQGQIETALKKFRTDLELRMRSLFSDLHIQSHLTGAGIRKCEGYKPLHLMFILINMMFLPIKTVHALMHRPLTNFFQAHKDTFYRFKKGEWSWRPFYRRFLTFLGQRLQWSRTLKDNYLILDTTVLAKRGKTMENLSLVYDHSKGKTVSGYEVLTLGLLTPQNFFPVDFDFRFSSKAPKGAGAANPLKPRGETARRLKEGRGLTKPEMALKMLKAALAQGLPALCLLVDAWFTSPKFCQAVKQAVKELNPKLKFNIIGRLKRDKTLYYLDGAGYTLTQLYQAYKDQLLWAAALGLSLIRVPVTCGNGLPGAIVFTKGYKEPDPEARPKDKKKSQPSWTGFFTTDLTLSAIQVVQKYLCRWSIEVFFKEAKQRLELGHEQGHSFAAQVFSVLKAFLGYSLLAYLLEKDEQSETIGDIFRQLEEETGKLTFMERLRQHFSTFLKTALDTLADYFDPDPEFRSYLDIITNTFNQFFHLQGCET
jgi:hypothetical protein